MTVQLFDNGFLKHRQMSILDLPTEILTEIFQEVVTSSFRSSNPKELRENFKALCLVHPRFYVITQDITIPHRFGLHLSQDERLSVDSQGNHSQAEISKDKPRQWCLLFQCWEIMNNISPNMDKNTFRDQITLLKNNEVDDPDSVFSVTPLSLRSRVLSKAAALGHRSVVQFVLNHNSNIPIYIRDDSLRQAAWHGHVEVVKEFLKAPEISEEAKGESLISAAGGGHLEVVKELLKVPEISEESKANSLTSAAWDGHLEVVKEFLKAPEISAQTKGKTLIMAAGGGHLEVAKELLKVPEISEEAKEKSLKRAIVYGRLEVISGLLRAEEISEESKANSLKWAIEYGHLKGVKELLKEALNDYGRSAEATAKSVVSAVRCGCLEVVKLTFRSLGSRFFH